VSYQVVLRPAAVRALQRMPGKIAAACREFIDGPLAENPHRAGRPLLEPLAPQYSARRSEYRAVGGGAVVRAPPAPLDLPA
jgi:mRNA interferase RelE/StbE